MPNARNRAALGDDGEPLEPPAPVRCANCDRTRGEHSGPFLKCPGLFGKFFTTPDEIRD